jgi:hypothetical protein
MRKLHDGCDEVAMVVKVGSTSGNQVKTMARLAHDDVNVGVDGGLWAVQERRLSARPMIEGHLHDATVVFSAVAV